MFSPDRRFTNRALLVVVPGAVLTGLFANAIGTDWIVDPATIHGIVALAIVALVPWKTPIVGRGWTRRRRGRWMSVGLMIFVVTTLASGLAHSTGLVSRIGPLTVMQVHIGSAFVATGLLVPHYRARPVGRPTVDGGRRGGVDRGRRTFLRTSATGLSAAALWLAWEGGLVFSGVRGSRRRYTGSHERGSGDPSAMPVTSWLDDEVQRIESGTWHLDIDGTAMAYETLVGLPHEDLDAVLDCTSGWYSEQRWSGVRLSELVPGDSRSVVVRSATGYRRLFPRRDLDRIWLVTGAGGNSLSAGHGFPARIVAPGRRGFWWVKWVVSIESTDRPWWWQLPFPAT